jgi:hypothetical protein
MKRPIMSRSRVVTGKLAWYQVWDCCHWIAFFSMSIGVLNYPHLDWWFVRTDAEQVEIEGVLRGFSAFDSASENDSSRKSLTCGYL